MTKFEDVGAYFKSESYPVGGLVKTLRMGFASTVPWPEIVSDRRYIRGPSTRIEADTVGMILGTDNYCGEKIVYVLINDKCYEISPTFIEEIGPLQQ